MQFRFREYIEDEKKYKLISISNVDDYDIFFKTLTFMQEHKCEFPIEVNNDGIVESGNTDNYYVENVAFCISKDYSEEDGLRPHFVVDVKEAF